MDVMKKKLFFLYLAHCQSSATSVHALAPVQANVLARNIARRYRFVAKCLRQRLYHTYMCVCVTRARARSHIQVFSSLTPHGTNYVQKSSANASMYACARTLFATGRTSIFQDFAGRYPTL